ncbi:MAG: hypothetical protein ABI446_03370 [Gemmatimonadaceae bacterium]
MLGVPLLRPPDFVAACDACGALFDPGAGGYCAQCSRLLCERHYHGSRWEKLWRVLTRRTLCRDCARQSTAR